MDALRVIPQVFFDLFARVVPGAVVLIVVVLAVPEAWTNLANQLRCGPAVLQESGALWILTLFVVSYAAGQILSPIGTFFQYLVDSILRKDPVIKPLCGKSDASGRQANFVTKEVEEHGGGPLEELIWIWYDWLRV